MTTKMGVAEQMLPPWLYEHYRAARATGTGQYRYGTRSLDEIASQARQYIGNDNPVIDYQPGNGTRYLIVLARTPDGRMVALPHFNKVGFVGLGYVTPDYVAEKLDLKPVDAEVVAEFLTLLSYANGYE